MKFKGKIDNINHIVISDPTYKEDVWCRYEKKDINEKDWIVNLDIYPTETKIDDYNIKGVEFLLLLKKNEYDCNIDEDGNLSYLKDIELKDYTIGMDSACVALGLNNNAKEIIDSQEEWQPSCAIRTGTDGTFGDVSEGIKDGKLCFLFVTGYFDEEFINQNELFDYLVNQFQIKELIKEDFELLGDNRVLKKGDKVEVSSCAITNDVGGTTIIRNSNYKDEVDGTTLTVENPDGTIENTTIESHDKLVNLPIEIEVVDSFYDYETGYKYEGKITNESLISEFKKIGTTGFKPEDYKKYNNKSLYEDALKASKTFNPSIIHFSEFDVIKLIEKNKEQEMEI